MPYIYQADIWCDSCGQQIRQQLKADGKAPKDPSDEYSYDSDDYPKYASDDEPVDSPNHCAAHADCLEALELHDGSKVGALVQSNLTSDGVEYVRAAVAEGSEVATTFWTELLE